MLGLIVGAVAGITASSVAEAVIKEVVKPQNLTKVNKVIFKVGTFALTGTICTKVWEDWEDSVNEIITNVGLGKEDETEETDEEEA